MIRAGGLRYAALVTWSMAALFFAGLVLLAIVIPFHAQDALTFGEWSRLIAEHWHLRYDAATPQEYGRPLYYVLQGWLWGFFGVSEISGRLFSAAFAALLLVAIVALVRSRAHGRLAALLAVAALIAVPVYAEQAIAGLTDVPVAALVAVAGVFVLRAESSQLTAVAAGAAAALAILAKPSAFLALFGLAATQLMYRGSLRLRLLYGVAPLAAGIGLGLAYDISQARYVHQDLRTFLQAGVNTDYYRTLADEARRFVLLDAGWFGDGLRVATIFALLYTVARVARAPHRLATGLSVGVALFLSWFGPWLAARENDLTVGSLHSAGAFAVSVGTAAFLALGVVCAPRSLAPPAELARLAIWALPTVVAWALYGAYDLRLLAPAWPPLLALVALTALPAATAVARRGAVALAVPFALFAVAVAANFDNLDGLGRDGWRQLRQTGDWLDPDTTRAIVMPAFNDAIGVARRQMQVGDDLVSPEGAFRFFFPGHVEQSYPNGCGFLQRFRLFVLTTDEGTRRYMQDFLHVSPDPSYWAACSSPRLSQLTDGSNGYAIFRIEP